MIWAKKKKKHFGRKMTNAITFARWHPRWPPQYSQNEVALKMTSTQQLLLSQGVEVNTHILHKHTDTVRVDLVITVLDRIATPYNTLAKNDQCEACARSNNILHVAMPASKLNNMQRLTRYSTGNMNLNFTYTSYSTYISWQVNLTACKEWLRIRTTSSWTSLYAKND